MAQTQTKRPADLDQCSQSCSSKKLRPVEDNPQRSDSGGSDDDWPTVFSGNEVVWQDSAHNLSVDVKEVKLGGEQHCSFNVGMDRTCFLNNSNTQFVEVDKFALSTTNSSQPNFSLRAHLRTCRPVLPVASSWPMPHNYTVCWSCHN